MRSSKARARCVRTLDRCMAGARDHAPDLKAAWASVTVRWTSSELAASTLHELVSLVILIDRDVRTYVQICKPVAGFVTENLKITVKSHENLVGIVALTLHEIPSQSGSRQRRHVGRRERNGHDKELQSMIIVWLEFVASVVVVSHTA
jgi:hypothetical protein